MKAGELKEMTTEELEQRCREVQQELFNFRMQKTTGQVEKPSRIRELRRDVARMKTIISGRAQAEEQK